jgi:hypothetical protein
MTDQLAAISSNRGVEPKKLSGLVKGELDWIVMKALEKDRGRRYETASALADDIGRFLDHQPVLATPPSAGYKLRKFVRRNRGTVIAGGVIGATLLIAAGVSLAFGLGEARQRKAAESAEPFDGRINCPLGGALRDYVSRDEHGSWP